MSLLRIAFYCSCITLLTACAPGEIKQVQQPQQVVPDTESVQAQEPSDQAKVLVEKGLAELKSGKMAVAKADLAKAVALAPHYAKAQYSYGYYLLKSGDTKAAKQAYDQAVQLAPHDPGVMNSYGVYLCSTGDYQQSVNYFIKASKVKGFAHVAMAYQNAGLCAAKGNMHLEAIRYYQMALHYDRSLTLPYLYIAQSYYRMKDYSKSQDYLHRFDSMSLPNAQSQALADKLAQAIKKQPPEHIDPKYIPRSEQ